MPKKLQLIGKRFGRLVVIGNGPRSNGSNKYEYKWHCICDCGNERNPRGYHLTSGAVVSCGCLRREKATTHGMSKSKIFGIWHSMKERCLNKNSRGFKNYGKRGIKVCKRWMEFENFYSDMGNRPDGMSLGRKNNDGPYSPKNCEWQTASQQALNTSRNVLISCAGKTKPITAWANEIGINISTLRHRIKKGYPIKTALFSPVGSL